MDEGIKDFGLVVVGATPGGIAAAVSAARLGCSVVLIERHAHVGGMTASGLGKSDVQHREVIGGIFREFVQRVFARYRERYAPGSEDLALCRNGYYAESSVAESVFQEMLGESGKIVTLLSHEVRSVEVDGSRMRSVEVVRLTSGEGNSRELRAPVFIDATYEGDLLALAGAEYRLGREGRDEYGERHAGMIYYDYERGIRLPESTGEGDDRLPAYTYRFCLSRDPGNARPFDQPPEDYNPEIFMAYHEDLKNGLLSAPAVFKEGRGYYPEHFDTLVRALSVTDLPNGKVDANINPRPLAFPFPEENAGYIEGDGATRERIARRHRNLCLGLLWFLQQDKSVPEADRREARKYQLPLDEFPDNGNFSWQLYVREGRRLAGRYTLTEHDITVTQDSPSTPEFEDVVAMGEFPIDSFPVRKKQAGDRVVLEGYLGMLDEITRPYSIPYRVMLPVQVEGLLAAVPVSATHVAFSSVRMEPTWMALGQAAGCAAYLCDRDRIRPHELSVGQLQKLLFEQGQILPASVTDDFISPVTIDHDERTSLSR